MRRNRILYAVFVGVVIVLGLASRRYPVLMPDFLAKNAGDTLWALMMFVLVGFVWRDGTTWKVAAFAAAISYLDEISQLYHAPWIDAIRHTTLGALVLGFGFLWSDMACYTVGVAIGAGLETLGFYVLRRKQDREQVAPTTSV